MVELNGQPSWKMDKVTWTCLHCAKEFAAGEPFWSRLVDDPQTRTEQSTLRRESYCQDHWPAPGPSFCFWRSQRKVEEGGPRMLDSDSLLSIFRELAVSDEPRKLNFRYLLALILMRKKLLREEREHSAPSMMGLTDGVDAFEVQIPRMDEAARKTAEEDLGQIIVGLPVSVPTPNNAPSQG